MRKIGKFIWAFLAVLAVFLCTGLATLGSVQSTGDSMTYVSGKTVMYKFSGGKKQLGSVYVNVGTIYEKIGDRVSIEIEYSSQSSPSTSGGTDLVPAYYMSNVYSSAGKNGLNYNWQEVTSGKSVSTEYLYFKASANLQLCEIVALDKDGEVIPMTPYTGSKDFTQEERAKTLDAQAAFNVEQVKAANTYSTFTQEEGLSMTAIHTLSAKSYQGFVYNLDGNFGVLSTLFMAGSVAIFGQSVFALRLAPFIASAIALVFLFLLCKDLFKSEKYAFFTALLFALGGVGLTVGRVGAPYAMVAAAILGSAYFTHRFFSKGISSKTPLKSGANLLFSGAFAAVAIAMETLSIVPVAAILVLFGFGVARIYKAEKLALEKLGVGKEEEGQELDETQKKAIAGVKAEYGYKKRVAFSFGGLAFVVLTLFTFLAVGAICYKPLVLVYDNVGTHSMSFLSLIFTNALDSAKTSGLTAYTVENTASVFSWLLPLKTTYVYTAHTGTQYLAFGLSMNMGLAFLSLVALLFTTIRVAYGFVKKTADKAELRLRRIYFILLSAMASTMIAAGVKGMPTLLSATVFSAAFAAFVPLAAMSQESCACEKCKKIADVILYASAAVAAVFFALSLPVYYGFAVSHGYESVFIWTTFLRS